MSKKSKPDECLSAAIRLLEHKDLFQSELALRLQAKGFGPEDIGDVIERLVRRKIVDDRRSMQNLAARMSGKRAVGVEKFRAELERRGAPEELINEFLAARTTAEDRLAMLELLGRKFRPSDDRSRAARFLLSRGFGEDQIESPLDEFFQTG